MKLSSPCWEIVRICISTNKNNLDRNYFKNVPFNFWSCGAFTSNPPVSSKSCKRKTQNALFLKEGFTQNKLWCWSPRNIMISSKLVRYALQCFGKKTKSNQFAFVFQIPWHLHPKTEQAGKTKKTSCFSQNIYFLVVTNLVLYYICVLPNLEHFPNNAMICQEFVT